MSQDGDEDAKLDEDRAAILRRRAVFLASAVAGLGLAASCGDPATPQPCLEMSEPPPTASGPDTAAPQPCLDVAPPPQPCLEVAAPEDAGPPDAGGTDAGVTDPDAGRDAGQPQPCLRKAPPQACLKVVPQPCLTPVKPSGQ